MNASLAAGLGRELKNARVQRNRSLRDVAGAAGISAGYLQKLERDAVAQPSPHILQRLAATLNLSYWRLMRLGGYETPRVTPRDSDLSHRLAAAGLTQVEERAVAAFIDLLVTQREADDEG